MNKNELTPQDNKAADILCVVSLMCHYIAPILTYFISFGIIHLYMGKQFEIDEEFKGFSLFFVISIYADYFVSWILMIYARVKYRNKMSFVIMIVYIAELIIPVLAIVLLAIICDKTFGDCPGFSILLNY